MKSFRILCVFLLFICTPLLSQFKKGYIITNSNDTTYGYIDFEGSAVNTTHCKFISLPDSTKHIYYPGDIKAFRFTGSKYFSTWEIRIDNELKNVFLEWLIKGRASILLYTPKDMKTRYFLKMDNDSLFELINTVSLNTGLITHGIFKEEVTYEHNSKEYVGTLIYCLRDCPSLQSTIENSSLGGNPLIKIVKKYQEITCRDQQCTLFEDKDRKLKCEIEVSCNKLFSQIRFNTKDVPEKSPLTQSFGVGVGINIYNLPLVSPRFSISTKFVYFNSLLYKYDYNPWSKENRLSSFNYLRIPWQLNYKFSYRKFTPVLSLGFTTDFRLGYTYYDPNLVQSVTTLYYYLEEIRIPQFGLDPGLGFKYSLTRQTAINIWFDYEHALKFFGGSVSDLSTVDNYFVQASFSFKLR
jgi:hypothetical protein